MNEDLTQRCYKRVQTISENADPRVIIELTRPTVPLTEGRFLEKIKVGTFEGLQKTSIALRRPRAGTDPDRIYVAYVADGVAGVRESVAAGCSEKTWVDAAFSAPALDVAIAFDGTMPQRDDATSEFVTSGAPWVFWVTPAGELKGRILGLLGEVTLAAANCTAVSAVRGTWSGVGNVDFGLIVFFVLSGALYYRQLIDGEWYDAELVSFGPEGVTWVDVAAFRTWDYRVGVQGKTATGAIYELFAQYQAFAKHSSEHALTVQAARAAGELTAIRYLDLQEAPERVDVAAVAAGAPYGGLYQTGAAELARAYNVADSNQDYGKIAVFVFDRHLVAADVAASFAAFSIVDSRGRSFTATSAALGADGLSVTLTFLDFNAAYGTCRAVYTPGAVTSMAGDAVLATSCAWTPENLTPPSVPAPEPVLLENIGANDLGYWRVDYYNWAGTQILHREYVADGADATWHYGDDEWATEPNGQAVADVTENVQENLTLYAAIAYTPLAYIQNTGPQYINTGYTVQANSRFVLEAELICESTSSDASHHIFGIQRTSDWKGYGAVLMWTSAAEQFLIGKWMGSVNVGNVVSWLGKRLTITVDGSAITVEDPDGNILSAATGGTFASISGSVYLFLTNNAGQSVNTTQHCKMKLHRFRIYEGNTLARDFRPALDNNNAACLYETQAQTYFRNAGSGTFVRPT